MMNLRLFKGLILDFLRMCGHPVDVALNIHKINCGKSFSPGILPDVVQLADHMGHVGPHHLESYLFLSHYLRPVKDAVPSQHLKK